jgi:hypothetical protein
MNQEECETTNVFSTNLFGFLMRYMYIIIVSVWIIFCLKVDILSASSALMLSGIMLIIFYILLFKVIKDFNFPNYYGNQTGNYLFGGLFYFAFLLQMLSLLDIIDSGLIGIFTSFVAATIVLDILCGLMFARMTYLNNINTKKHKRKKH